MIPQSDPPPDPPQTRSANVGENQPPETDELGKEPTPWDPLLNAGHLARHMSRHELTRLGRDWLEDVLTHNTPDQIETFARYAAEVPNPERDLLPKILDGRVRPPGAPLAAIAHDVRQERADEHTSAA